MEIVKNLVEEDIILSNHKLSDKEIIRAYSAWVKKLNKQIVYLKEENENKSQLGLALYTALVKELEKQGLTDDIPSVIDQLVGKNCGKYANIYNEYKNQKKELALYKKALELACEKYIGVDGISYVIRDCGDYWEKSDEQVLEETIDYFLNEAREEQNGRKRTDA